MRFYTVFLIQLVALFSVVNRAYADSYVVREGDALSTIARAHFHGRLYGKDGILNKLLGVNAKEISNPDLVFPGQVVQLETTDSDRSLASEPVAEQEKTPEESSEPAAAPLELSLKKTAEPTPEQGSFTLLSITPSLRYSSFNSVDNATGGSAKVLSDLYPEVDFGWRQNWTKDTETNIHFAFAYYTTEPLQTRDLNPHSSSLSDFGLGFRSTVSGSVKLGLDFDSAQALIVRGANLNSLTTDRIQTNKVMAALRWGLISSGRLTLSTEVKGGLIAPAQFSDFSMSTGSSWAASVFLDQEVTAGIIHGGVFWNQSSYNTSITKQSDNSLGIEFGFGWNVGR